MTDSDDRILAAALEALDAGLGIYDAGHLLIAFNSQYARVRGAIGGTVRLGARWHDLIADGLRAGGIAEAIGHERQWFTDRRRRRGAYDATRVLPDGSRYQVSETRMPNGGIAAVWTPIRPPAPPTPRPPAPPAPLVLPGAVPGFDPAELRAQAQWLRQQAASAAPEHRESYLRLAVECERILEPPPSATRH